MVSAAELLIQLEDLGIAIQADDSLLRLKPKSKITPELIEGLCQHKADLLELLAWPRECLECERRFGQPHARLFPLIDRMVMTPSGRGRLIQVFADRVVVVLKTGGQAEYLLPQEIAPPGNAPVSLESRVH